MTTSLHLILGSEVETVTVYEAKTIDNFMDGQGVYICGGLKVLEFLGLMPGALDYGFLTEELRVIGSDGDLISKIPLTKIFNEYDDPLLKTSSENGNLPLTYFFSRGGFQKVVYDSIISGSYNKYIPRYLQDKTTINIKANASVAEVYEYDTLHGKKVAIKLSDGTVDDGYDIVIGCDGVQSKTRKYILSQDEDSNTGDLEYSGIRVIFASTEADPNYEIRAKQSPIQWQGQGLYIMEATVGGLNGPEHFAGISFASKKDAKFGENQGWQTNTEFLRAEVKKLLYERGFGKFPDLIRVFDKASRIVEVAVRVNPKPYKTWRSKSGRVVIAGDSAHKMSVL